MSQSTSKLRSFPEAENRPHVGVLGGIFKQMGQLMRQAMDAAFRRERVELSFAHFVTLYVLSVEPGVAGAELARRGFVSAQTMNTILRRLERDGSIERKPHPTNQRADSWYLTKTGHARLQRARRIAEGVWEKMFESFKDGELAQLRDLMERCLVGLEQQVSDRRSTKTQKTPSRARSRG